MAGLGAISEMIGRAQSALSSGHANEGECDRSRREQVGFWPENRTITCFLWFYLPLDLLKPGDLS
jgi:hypothetical protein